MSLQAKISEDLKTAMMQKNEVERDALRMLKSELLNKEVELGRAPTDEETIAVLKRAVKTRQESIEQYIAGGRAELADKERLELLAIERYLPKMLDPNETRGLISAIVKELDLSGKKDMGRLMKEIKTRHGNLVDGKLASQIAGELLGS